ncbi:hypothetical protein [Brachybacterium paraconglomeratum]|uniref:hypothetical protein n=1 Tax=Brachybacterium paraconglomeratum TaxID=173362 RepID=UPI0021A42EF1|nr:hypothetical protein [Brachybacterium paraconglomeratum]MCT1908217.1 hypothetical protein [Brachybacterium paraconglomeratum]
MKNATIATSRTRATSDHLIAYRPLPRAWGDVDALHAVRERRTLAAAQGLDPSTLELPALSDTTRDPASGYRSAPTHRPVDSDRSTSRRRAARSRRPASRPVPAGRHRERPAHPGLLAPLFGVLRGA